MAVTSSIPGIPTNIDPALWQVLSAIKNNLDYLQQNPATSNGVDQAQLMAAVAAAVTGITKGDTGAPGSPGADGSDGADGQDGKTYVLDIIGGRTSVIYDHSGANPLPAMAAFSAELYEDGVLVTSGITYNWFIPGGASSLLSGTSGSATFTPTVAATFDSAKADNAVALIATYAGKSFRANEPIAVTRVGNTGADGADGSDGANGLDGTDGANGKTYLLFITGGKTNAVYDTSGANPLPSPTAFGCELYEDGSLVTPDTYAWSVPASNSLLTGSSSTATFTPTLAPTFDANKGDNRVLLTVTYAGQTIKAVQPIVITQQVSGTSPDMTTPNAIDNLEVTGGVLYNFLTWGTNPTNTDIDHIDIYRAATDDRASAAVIGTTKARVYADYIPAGVGTAYYYWLRAVSRTGVVGDWNLVSGVVSSAGTSSTPLAIGDSQVGTISATKILAATLSAISANLGTVTAGTIQSGDETFKIDLANKSITVAGVGGVASADYTIMQNGQLQFWKWTGSTHQQGQSLNTIESGQAANGALVTLSKWYAAIPNIMISPNDTPVYNKDYSSQSQKLQIRAENVAISVGGEVTFNAVSRLVLSGANPSFVVTDSYTGSNDTDTTATYTTAPNTTKIDCSVSFSSKRGTGTSPNFYYRKVDARIAYRTSPSGSWNYTSWTTTNINNDFNPYTASLSTGAITSGTYDFYVEFSAADRGGTFTNGDISYDLADSGNLSLSSNSALVSATSVFTDFNVGVTFPSYTPPSGYDVYKVDYLISYGWYSSSSGGVIKNKSGDFLKAGVGGTLNVPAATDSYTYTLTTTSYAPSQNGIKVYKTSSSESETVQGKIFTGSYSKVYVRKPQSNSSTPENVFTLIGYSLTLSSAQIIDSSGTLNWVAIG